MPRGKEEGIGEVGMEGKRGVNERVGFGGEEGRGRVFSIKGEWGLSVGRIVDLGGVRLRKNILPRSK